MVQPACQHKSHFHPLPQKETTSLETRPRFPARCAHQRWCRPPPADLYAQTQISRSPVFTPPAAPSWPPAFGTNQGQDRLRSAPSVAELWRSTCAWPVLGHRRAVQETPYRPDRAAERGAAGGHRWRGGWLCLLAAGQYRLDARRALSGYTAFTSPDHTFCLVYPTGSQVANSLKGTGVALSGPAHQVFTVANIGAFSGTPTDYDVGFCDNLVGRVSQITSVTLDGQVWTQAHCAFDVGTGRAIVESVIYKGNLYHMDYGSSAASFLSNQSQTFTPMEQSFRFLS